MLSARLATGMILTAIEKLVSARTGVTVKVCEPQAVEQGAIVVAPVLAKYNAGLPAWLVPYEPELKAIVFFGGVLFQVFVQVQAAKKAAAAEAAPATPAAA